MINSEKHTFLPDNLKFFFRKLIIRCSGLLLICFALALAAALATYDSADPSFNTASGNTPQNALGSFGAICSDLLWQYFGLGALLFPAAIFSWGIIVLRLKWHKYQFLRALCFVPTLFLLLILFSALPAVSLTPLIAGFSGAIMPAFYHPLVYCMNAAHMPYLEYVMLAIVFAASFFGLAWTLGIPFYLVKRWITALGRGIKAFFLFLKNKLQNKTAQKQPENEESFLEDIPESLFDEEKYITVKFQNA